MTSRRRSARSGYPPGARHYTRNIGYLRAQRVGAPRIDLDGNEAGVADSRAGGERAAGDCWNPRRYSQAEGSPKPEPPAKRDGLVALKEAGKRRRAAA